VKKKKAIKSVAVLSDDDSDTNIDLSLDSDYDLEDLESNDDAEVGLMPAKKKSTECNFCFSWQVS